MPRMPKLLRDVIWLREIPLHWKSTRRFMAAGFRMVQAPKSAKRHWVGGPPSHHGAKCTVCKRPLTLIWDLSLADKAFPEMLRDAFSPIVRLPLYACLKCPSPTCYVVRSETAIRCLPQQPISSEGSPLADLPSEFPRRPVQCEPIPSVVDGLLTLVDGIGFGALDEKAKRQVRRFYRRKIDSPWDLPFSQFGGQPKFVQGHWDITCPNPRCAASRIEVAFDVRTRALLMKELAVVDGHGMPEIRSAYAQIAYHICCLCHAIHAQYRCS